MRGKVSKALAGEARKMADQLKKPGSWKRIHRWLKRKWNRVPRNERKLK